MQSFKSKFVWEVWLFLTVIFEFGLPPLPNSKRTGTSWAKLAQRGSDVEVSTQQNKRGYFLMHSERCEGSQDSFLRFWAAVCIVGTLLLKITAKKASMNRKFPFTVHRQVGMSILSGKALFACTGTTSILLDTVCSAHFTPECFWERHKEIFKTRISSSHQEEKHQQSYLNGIVEWWANIYLPFVLTSHVR